MYIDNQWVFVNRLLNAEPTVCPKCSVTTLEQLHKRTGRRMLDWKCPNCGKVYKALNMLTALQKN